MPEIYKFLDENRIAYKKFEHPAVFTCEEAVLLPEMPGVGTKNLFLRDKNGKRHFLVSVGHDKSVDLKKLEELLDVSKLGFGSPERLQKYLGVLPGSVTLLGVINDPDLGVEVIIDKEIWSNALQCHPLVNTATLVIEPEEMKKFLEITKHELKIVDVPGRKI
ncbi:MAG: prolyl-tRNA synthetase associated domain-containing protein [Candidatus Gracilibacteria bacterium]